MTKQLPLDRTDTSFDARKKPHVPVRRDTPSGNAGAGATDADAQTRHRRAFSNFAQNDSHDAFRPVMNVIYGHWKDLNHELFSGALIEPHIILAEPTHPSAMGDYTPVSGWGSGSQIRIRPNILIGTHPAVRPGDKCAEGRLRLVLDIAKHETLHQVQFEIKKEPEESYRGHGPVFRDLCNEAGLKLGLGPARAAKARGRDRDLPSCAHWPMCVRPKDYYLGAYRPHDPNGPQSEEDQSSEFLNEPRLPQALEMWIKLHPEWAVDFREVAFAAWGLFDQFFASHPTPGVVRKQAMGLMAKGYRPRKPKAATNEVLDNLPACQ